MAFLPDLYSGGMTNRVSGNSRAAIAIITLSTVLLGACASAETVAQPALTAGASQSPMASPVEPRYRALGEPIAPWTCDELIPPFDGETTRTASDVDERDAGIEGEIACSLTLSRGAGDPPDAVSVSVMIADLGEAAEQAVLDADCCRSGDLVAAAEPPRRETCAYAQCSSSIAVNGFGAFVWSLADSPEHIGYHQSLVAALAERLAEAARPNPLPAVDVSDLPLSSCDAAPEDLARKIGDALGESAPARAESAPRGDGAWITYWLDARRAVTQCDWYPSEAAGDQPVQVTVTPGATEALGVAGLPFVDIDDPSVGTRYSFAVADAVVTVSRTDRATAQAIAEAHG